MKKIISLIICISVFSCNQKQAETVKTESSKSDVPALDKTIAIKPPMGWNSWDCLGWEATEADVKANADYMAKNLKKLGYEYIVIDMLWYGDQKAISFEDFVQERIPTKPKYFMDNYGRLIPSEERFPSSKGGKGLKPLADYVHSLGLKFGIHMMRGIPWEAAEKDLEIMGSTARTKSIGQPDKACDWYDGFYGVDMSKPGAQEYYNSVYKLYADWGIDYIKADDMVNKEELAGTSKAIRSSGRKMLYSVVPADDIPLDFIKENAHMARTGFDFWDVWQMLKVGFPVAKKVVKYTEPGFWPDLDMLPIGKIGKKISYKGPNERISNFTQPEVRNLMSLWYISKMPLMIGGYLPETDKFTESILQNEEALAVNRNCINPRQIKFRNAHIAWAADIPNSDDKYVAIFNMWESKEPITHKITMAQLGLPAGEYKVRDLWAKKDLPNIKGDFVQKLAAHDGGLYRISKI